MARNPIAVETLAEGIVCLAATEVSGLLSIAGRKAVTREDYARKLAAHWDIGDRGLIEPVRAADISDTPPSTFASTAAGPRNSSALPLPGIDEVLAGTRRPK